MFLPNLVTTYFIAPRRLQFDQSITPFYDDKNLPSLGYYSLQTIIPTATFTKPGLYVLAVDVFDGELTTTEEMPAVIRDGSIALKYDAWLSQYFSDTDM
ncbi:MAG: hypothetical protein ACO3MX_08965, partial [Candidatus Puniceispirillaceae bacterium]